MHNFNNAQTPRCPPWRHDPYSMDGPVFKCPPTLYSETEPLVGPITATRFAARHPEAEPIRRQTPPPAPVQPVACRRKGCMADMPLEAQLAVVLSRKTPQRNRGNATISDAALFRTAICKHAKKGHCCCGSVCWMAHSKAELRTKVMNIAEGIVNMKAVSFFIQKAVEAKCDAQREKFAGKMVPDFDEEPALMDGARVGGQIATVNSISGEVAM